MEQAYWTQVAGIVVVVLTVFFVPGREGRRSRFRELRWPIQSGLLAILLLLWFVVPSRLTGRLLLTTYPRQPWLVPVVIWLALTSLFFLVSRQAARADSAEPRA